ncbi:MAG: LysM peptidoglycan-binding domain-containing protein [Saprospiraceae bacterium]
MKKGILIFSIVFISTLLTAQYVSKPIFTQGDVINIQLNKVNKLYCKHKVEKGHTIYSLSKIFGVSANMIYKINGLEDDTQLPLGQILKIPIIESKVFTGTTPPSNSNGAFIPIHYKAKKKDNLYRISKVYFKQDINQLMIRNRMTTKDINVDQAILIGWFVINGNLSNAKKDIKKVDIIENEIIVQKDSVEFETIDSLLKKEIPTDFNQLLLGTLTYSEYMVEHSKRTVAYWDKSIADNGTVFALHSTALIGSNLVIYNPLVKRSVRARVVGRIPYGSYTNEVQLVLSPRAAKQLGALDRRFNVELKMLKSNLNAE